MNKKQKEVELAKLKEEEKELKHLKAIYNKASDDIAKKLKISNGKINVLLKNFDELDDVQKSILQSQIYQRNFQLSLKKQIDGFLSDLQTDQYKSIDEYLKGCYETGFLGTMYDLHGQGIPLVFPIDQKQAAAAIKLDPKISKNLYTKLGEDVGLLKKRIANNVSRGIATASEYKVIARNIAADSNVGFNRAMRVARTEGHGVQVQAAVDVQHKAKEKGADVLKQWSAALDGRTRESHARVDGEIRELDEKFSNGLKYPGDSAGGAAEVVNCRCALLQRAKWALDEDELQTLKDRAAYYGLDKTKNFEDFKSKYLKAGEMVEFENNPYVLTDLPPAIYEYPDYEDYRAAVEEWKSKHHGSIYDYFNDDTIWYTTGEYKNQVEKQKMFDATVAKLSKDFPLEKEHATKIHVGTYEAMGDYLHEVQRSRMDVVEAQAQFWFNPDTNEAVIGFNPFGTKGTLADDLLNRKNKIQKGEVLRMVLDDSPEGVAIHEWGHGVSEYLLTGYTKGEQNSIDYAEWYKSLSKDDIKNGVSSYATTNRGEFEAECFAELLTGNPRPIAKKYGRFLEKASHGAIKFNNRK